MEPNITSNNTQKSNILNPKLLIIFVIVLLVIAALLYYFYFRNIKSLSKPLQQLDTSKSISPITYAQDQNKAVAIVGQEIIYQSDLDTEIAFQPPSKDQDLKKRMIEKIATDSAVLQGAREIALISLDDSTFNSKTKDYAKRVKLVKEIKDKIEKESDSVSGVVVSAWFLNGKEGSLGYENSKKLVFEKMSNLYAQVKDKKITLAQAADSIKNDSEISKIDPAYKVNALFNFQSSKTEPVTRDDDFNQAIARAGEGEITDLLVGTSIDQKGKPIESHYHFGQVTKRIVNDKILSLDDWLGNKRKVYALTIY